MLIQPLTNMVQLRSPPNAVKETERICGILCALRKSAVCVCVCALAKAGSDDMGRSQCATQDLRVEARVAVLVGEHVDPVPYLGQCDGCIRC